MIFCCRFFQESSEEEREHAEKLMEYQVRFVIIVLVFLNLFGKIGAGFVLQVNPDIYRPINFRTNVVGK